MSKGIDIFQDKRIQGLTAVISAVAALTAIFFYFDRKKHLELQTEIAGLDKNIKQLQLQKLKNGGQQ